MVRASLLLACSILLAACGASVNPALQSKINVQFGAAKSQTYNGGSFTPMKLAVGQWALYGTTNDGKRSATRQAIVGRDGDAWILETHSITESEESITQICIKGFEKAREQYSVDDIDILWVKMKKNDEPVSPVEGPVLAMTKGLYRKLLVNFVVKTDGLTDGGTVTVPAGTFTGTQQLASEVTFLMRTYKSTAWVHRAIPLGGMAKSVMTEDNINMVLLDFGTSGAKPSF